MIIIKEKKFLNNILKEYISDSNKYLILKDKKYKSIPCCIFIKEEEITESDIDILEGEIK